MSTKALKPGTKVLASGIIVLFSVLFLLLLFLLWNQTAVDSAESTDVAEEVMANKYGQERLRLHNDRLLK